MPKFSKRSKLELETCDLRLQIVMQEAIRVVDFSVQEGYRPIEEQLQAFKNGVSKLKKGKHNEKPSKAVDIAPYPPPENGWQDVPEKELRRFYFLAGVVQTIAHQHNIKIRWGGDWDRDYSYLDNNFDDLFHFELED